MEVSTTDAGDGGTEPCGRRVESDARPLPLLLERT